MLDFPAYRSWCRWTVSTSRHKCGEAGDCSAMISVFPLSFESESNTTTLCSSIDLPCTYSSHPDMRHWVPKRGEHQRESPSPPRPELLLIWMRHHNEQVAATGTWKLHWYQSSHWQEAQMIRSEWRKQNQKAR
jgi:hypothetical protein